LAVRLDGVLMRREEAEARAGLGDEPLADEDLRLIRRTRPGTHPWERPANNPARDD